MSNEYAEMLHDMPKDVALALVVRAFGCAAFDFPEGDHYCMIEWDEPQGIETLRKRVAHEWQVLYDAEIVSQPVSKVWRKYL